MNPNVRNWMFNSWKIWRTGLLQELSTSFRQLAISDFDNFMIGPDASNVFMTRSFFRETEPLPDEYMIYNYMGTGKLKDRPAAILTNKRLWLLPEGAGQFLCIELGDIKEYAFKGGTVSARWIQMTHTDGAVREYRKMGAYPGETEFRFVMEKFRKNEQSIDDLTYNTATDNIQSINKNETCAICSGKELGTTPHRFTWVALKKTGEVLKHHALFTGSMGGYADIRAYKADIAGKIITSVCSECLDKIYLQAGEETKRIQENHIKDTAKSKRIFRIVSYVAFALLGLTILYLQFIKHWPESDPANFALVVLPFVAIGALVISVSKSGGLAPLGNSTEAEHIIEGIMKAHIGQLPKLVAQSGVLDKAVIINENQCPSLADNDKELFVMSLNRYLLDEFQGYVLFNMEKTQHEPGGSRKFEVTYSDLMEFTANIRTSKEHTMNLGEYMVTHAD